MTWRRFLRWLAIGAVVLIALAGIFIGPRVYRLSTIGAGYIAKQMCSCIYVGEREFDSCRQDMPPDMFRVKAEVIEGGVRAWVTGIVERTASYRPESGCTLH
jgi:hypothetical protein